ncbi:MAG: ImuA family protein [Parasphingopyxis sp.]
MSDSALSLSALKARLAAYGAAPKEDGAERFGFGHDGLDNYLDGGLKRAQLHEIFADDAEDGGAAAGFAAMLGLCARPAGRPLLWLRTRKAEKRGGRFYAPGFIELGGDPDRLLLAIVADDLALLRGAGDALRCSGLGAVIAECWGRPACLDLTASRRLTLAASDSGVTALLLRREAEPTPSTADTRWSVRAAPSRALEARAPGPPMLDLTLLRRRGGAAGRSWRLEWDRERKRFAEPAREPAQEQTIPGAVVSVPAGQSPADRAPALAGTG